MSATDVKEIIYHCQCRRYVVGTPQNAAVCRECGRQHVPTEEFGLAPGQNPAVGQG